MKLPKAVNNLIEAFERLPGIGPKTAARLAYYLLQSPSALALSLSQALADLPAGVKVCPVCRNIGEDVLCNICSDQNRDSSVVCVVEKPLDIIAIERGGRYNGLYHVLGGAISPLNNIGPDELYIGDLVGRLRKEKSRFKEVILATNANLEGEATAMYLHKLIRQEAPDVRVTRIGRGLPAGADLEYADDVTLMRALEGRSEYQ